MSFIGTLYPAPETQYRVLSEPSINEHGRAYVRVDVETLGIQSNCWEDMQRLVDALQEGIDRAKQAEGAAGIPVGAVSA